MTFKARDINRTTMATLLQRNELKPHTHHSTTPPSTDEVVVPEPHLILGTRGKGSESTERLNHWAIEPCTREKWGSEKHPWIM